MSSERSDSPAPRSGPRLRPGARGGGPEFGPRGYLPRRAAQRARKIVLREQLGLVWVVAAAVAGVLLLGAGVWFVVTQLGPPRPPFAAAAAAADVTQTARVDVDDQGVLLVRAGGRLRAFLVPDTPVAYCPDSGRLEGADGAVWSLDGRHLGRGGASLAELPVEVHSGTVYVDPSTVVRRLEPRAERASPTCDPG